MIVFSGFIVLFNHMPIFMRYVSNISLLKYCLEALVTTIYERGRTDLKCPDEIMYCHYNKSETILKELGMDSESFGINILKILFQLFLFKGLSYITLRKRLLKG
jgi:ATP-binding cassette, subfamily G (WHITE), member 1